MHGHEAKTYVVLRLSKSGLSGCGEQIRELIRNMLNHRLFVYS